jgi:hypothetical protein
MLGAVLAVAVAAVLAGARSLAATGEARGPPTRLGRSWPPWGARHPLTGAWRSPAEATVRRVLACVDPDALDRAIGAWLAGQQPPTQPPPAPRPRRAVAVHGKTLRGSGHHPRHPRSPIHLLAVMDHISRAVLAQADVQATTNHQRGRPVPAAAGGVGPRRHRGHRRRAPHPTRARRLAGHRQARRLAANGEGQPAHPAPAAATPALGRHPCPRPHPRPRPRRVEVRRLQVTTVAGLDFPYATQALRITRRTRLLAGAGGP